MKIDKNIDQFRPLYYRLVALWVICEGVAGGIMHGLKIPFSGMIISGSAVICICLIGYFIPIKGAILRATIIVMIFKMMLSPHTPPTAYLAVAFQGVVGQLIFSFLKVDLFAPILLAVLALVESAFQRLLVLVILYGSEFWEAVNDFIKKLLGVKSITNYTLWIAGLYLFAHVVVGILIGFLVHSIVKKARKNELLSPEFIIQPGEMQSNILSTKKKKKRKKKWLFIFLWIVLLILFLQSTFGIGEPILPTNKALRIFIRSLLIVFFWYFIISPFLIRWIKKQLNHHKEKTSGFVQVVAELLPSIEWLFKRGWQMSAVKKRISRLVLFWKIVLGNILLMDSKYPTNQG